jgi:hypothetical protein
MICTAQIIKRTAIFSVLISLLLIPAYSEARIMSVQMSAPTIAFGGYSWPGVGQYEKITGVAYAEVDPADHRNSVIVDIKRRPELGSQGKLLAARSRTY